MMLRKYHSSSMKPKRQIEPTTKTAMPTGAAALAIIFVVLFIDRPLLVGVNFMLRPKDADLDRAPTLDRPANEHPDIFGSILLFGVRKS